MGVLGLWRDVLRGIFGAAARREWAVLPRNSGVFRWRVGAARRFSARRTVAGTRGEKIFKNLLERGEKPKNWGARGVGGWSGRTLYRVCEVILRCDFLGLEARPLAALLGVHFAQAPQLRAPA